MSEFIRVSGKTLEDAITNATIQLGVTSDHIVYNVIEHESKGFLGLVGQKDAVIEVRVKTEADEQAENLRRKAEEGILSSSEEEVQTEDTAAAESFVKAAEEKPAEEPKEEKPAEEDNKDEENK